MFHTEATVNHRGRTLTPVVRHDAEADVRLAEADDRRRRLAAERAMDSVLADSFPASDPPPWTLGIAHPQPVHHAKMEPVHDMVLNVDGQTDVVSDGAIGVSRPNRDGRTIVQGLRSLAGAVGIALLAPFVILLVGLPVALAVRGTLEVIGFLLR